MIESPSPSLPVDEPELGWGQAQQFQTQGPMVSKIGLNRRNFIYLCTYAYIVISGFKLVYVNYLSPAKDKN